MNSKYLYLASLLLCIACAVVIGRTAKYSGETDYFQRISKGMK